MAEKIGIALLDREPSGPVHGKTRAEHCAFVGKARKSKVFWVSGEEITCPLARFNLGIDSPTPTTIERLAQTLVSWGDANNVEVAKKFIAGLRPLPARKRFFIYGPLEKMPTVPDIVLFILTPEEAFNHVLHLTRATGVRCNSSIGAVGALCGECTAVPLLTKRAAISVGCSGSRYNAHLRPNELFLSIPYPLYHAVILT